MNNISGKCSLVIRGKDVLDFNEINNKIEIMPSEKWKKGEVFSKLDFKGAPSDVWIYSLQIDQDGSINKTLDKLLNKIKRAKEFIMYLSNSADICIRCYVQSDLAQIGFDFSPYIINELADLNIRVEISILSWGQIEL